MVMLARLPEGKLQQLQHALSVGMVGGTDTAIGSLPKNNWFRQQNRWGTEMVNDGEWWSYGIFLVFYWCTVVAPAQFMPQNVSHHQHPFR